MGNPNATMMEIMAYLQVRGDIQIPDLDLTPGDAGTVSVTTPALTLSADASIQTSTGWEGNAGQIVGNVASLSIDGGSFISSSSGIVLRNPDGTIIGPVVGPGNAGASRLQPATRLRSQNRTASYRPPHLATAMPAAFP